MIKKQSKVKARHYLILYAFILPAIAIIGIFKYIPFVSSIYRSFFNWNGANINIFIGFDNYINLFGDRAFHAAVQNILYVGLFIIIVNLIFPFFAAELVHNVKNRRFQNFFKLGFIVPMVVPAMVITLLWRWILGGEFGALNMLLNQVGLGELARPWLGMQETALTSMLFIGFPWVAGLPFLLYLAGLQSIPKDLYEVADIEGMNKWQKLWYLDIPLVASQRKLVITFMTIQAFQFFDQPFILTNGGPGTSTLTPALFLYQTAFDRNQFGYSASIGVVLFLFVIMLTIFNQRVMKDSERMD